MPKEKKTHWLRWILSVILAVAVGVLVGWRRQSGDPVAAYHVEKHKIVETVVGIGRVVPPATLQIGSMRLGSVTKVFVEEGEQVKAGDLLLHFDDAEPLAAVARTEVQVRQERLKLQNLKKFSTPNAKNDVERAELEVEQAEDDFNRIQVLFASAAANSAQLDLAKNRLDSAKKKREKFVLEAGELGPRGGTYRLALASLAAAEAQLEQEKARLAYSHVHAPTDGVVLAREVEPGTVVQPGQTLVVLAKTGETRIEIPIDEKNLGKLNVGDRAMVSTDAFPNRVFRATVSKLAPAVDRNTGTLDVTLDVPEPPDFLRAQMTVSVEIELEFKPVALVFPAEALQTGNDGKYFVYIDGNGVVEKRDVNIGVRGDFLLEAETGLKEGDIVLLPGSKSVDAGQKVRSEAHKLGR